MQARRSGYGYNNYQDKDYGRDRDKGWDNGYNAKDRDYGRSRDTGRSRENRDWDYQAPRPPLPARGGYGAAPASASKDGSGISPGSVAKWVVQSLYLDEAYPRAPLIQWYFQQLLGVKLHFSEIKSFLDEAPGVRVEPQFAKKSSFAAVLEEPPAGFKGFSSDGDCGPLDDELLDAMSVCLSQGGWPKEIDVQHKYFVVASWLQDRCPEVEGLPFGKLLSIVKSCAQPNGIGVLGHRDGLVVPYAQSEDCERRINAVTGKPTAVAPDEEYVRNWAELRQCLSEHLLLQPDQLIEVSKVKAMFRHSFRRELSETVFGHEGLTKLLSDERLGPDFSLGTTTTQKVVAKGKGDAGSHTYVLRYLGSKVAGPYEPPHAAAPAAPEEVSSIQLQ